MHSRIKTLCLVAGAATSVASITYLAVASQSNVTQSKVPQAAQEAFSLKGFGDLKFKKEKLPIKEKCESSFDRIWEDDLGNYLQSPKFKKSLGPTGKYVDKSFPADHTSLYW